jgi:hypothetical protein
VEVLKEMSNLKINTDAILPLDNDFTGANLLLKALNNVIVSNIEWKVGNINSGIKAITSQSGGLLVSARDEKLLSKV